MDSEVNPYEVFKDVLKRVLSFKTQNLMILSLLFLHIYKKVFPHDFLIIKNIIIDMIPINLKKQIQLLIIPVLNLLFLIGFLGILIFFILVLILDLNDKRGWFNSFRHNYEYYFAMNHRGIFDSFISNLIALPVNIGIIIEGTFYVFDNPLIYSYMESKIILHIAPIIVLGSYFSIFIGFFFRKVEDYQ